MRRAAFHGCLLDINIRYVAFPSSRLFNPCAFRPLLGGRAGPSMTQGRHTTRPRKTRHRNSPLALLLRPRRAPRCRFQPPRRWRVCLCVVGHSARPTLRSVATSRRTRGRSPRNFAPRHVRKHHVPRHRLARAVPPCPDNSGTLRDRRAVSPALRYSLSYAIRHRTVPHATTTRPRAGGTRLSVSLAMSSHQSATTSAMQPGRLV